MAKNGKAERRPAKERQRNEKRWLWYETNCKGRASQRVATNGLAKAKSSCAGAKRAVHYIERRRQSLAGKGTERRRQSQAVKGTDRRRRGIELTAMRSKGIEWNRQVMIARAKHGTARQRQRVTERSGGRARSDISLQRH